MPTKGGAIAAIAITLLAGGGKKPPANWSEVDIHMPAVEHAYRHLDQEGNLVGANNESLHEKVSPKDFFRIVELAPKAIHSPDALKEPPATVDSLLHIKTGDGANYYFAGEQEHFKDASAQEIWTILRKYRGGAW